MSENQGGVKRKRSKNTTTQQYEVYLQFMEEDYVFRSNTINPLLEPDYLIKKWQELVAILNSMENGPALTVDEWKKRFADWKYATRSKSRKIKESGRRTGAGSKLNLELTPVEERGLAIWGNVSVEGTKVMEFEGIEPHITILEGDDDASLHLSDTPDIIEAENLNGCLDVSAAEGVAEPEAKMIKSESVSVADTTYLNTESIYLPERSPSSTQKRTKRPKLLSVLAENLIETTDSANRSNQIFQNTIKTFCNEYLSVEKRKLQLKEEKLRFKIAKFKFKHKEFKFDL